MTHGWAIRLRTFLSLVVIHPGMILRANRIFSLDRANPERSKCKQGKGDGPEQWMGYFHAILSGASRWC
jgi:hypothetical protein